MKKYVVRPGDSLYSIAKKTGVRIPLILAANPEITSPAKLIPGMTLSIPELGKSSAGGQKKSKTSKATVKVPSYFGFVWPHVVQEGENVESLSELYNVSVLELCHLNGMSPSDTLDPGRVVYIPSAAPPKNMMKDKTVMPTGSEENINDWEGPHTHTGGLRKDIGSPAAAESSYDLSSWSDILTDTRGQSETVAFNNDLPTSGQTPVGGLDDEGWSDTITYDKG
ncbi:LysM peptidoglycan-binding domain-containing protein [Alicyclobacillus tolerans]|uniref:LysM peptidoglycan-binding domain-containing protein n=1 Tax=Alicyclobacillus tolerans TaxID=90970 RepID=UPI003B7977B1